MGATSDVIRTVVKEALPIVGPHHIYFIVYAHTRDVSYSLYYRVRT